MYVKTFIRRPILSCVVSIIIVLLGIVALFQMPLAQYPNISPPTIMISASYPGASAETIDRVVAAQLEAQLNGVSNLLYMSSVSDGSGYASITLTFEVGTNLNLAMNGVLNRVHAAMPLLPHVVQDMGINVRKSSPHTLLGLAFYNTLEGFFDDYYISNYLKRTVFNDLNLIPGVGRVDFWGKNYAMRIWLDLNAMNALNITADDIANAIKEQSNDYIIGRSISELHNNGGLSFNIDGSYTYSSVSQFKNIIIRAKNNQIIRIKDIARVEIGAQNYNVVPILSYLRDDRVQRKEVVFMQVLTEPSANQLSVKHLIMNKLKEDSCSFPVGLEYKKIFDSTDFIEASINNIIKTLSISCVLVGLVIFIFLQNIHASLIAIIIIPISLIGSLSLLNLFGFSLNTINLFAMILSVGIVVDDIIIIVENIERLKTKHKSSPIQLIVELAIKEIFGAIIAIAMVLSLGFFPIMYLPGLPGILYRQFAITIACTVLISTLVSLTLGPSISCMLLDHKIIRTANWFQTFFNKIFDGTRFYYLKLANKTIRLGKYTLIPLIITIILIISIFKIIPTSFIPDEDQGYFMTSVALPSSANLQDTKKISNEISNKILHMGGVERVMQIIGLDFFTGGTNSYAAGLIIWLKNWRYRGDLDKNVTTLVEKVNFLNEKYKDITIRAFSQPTVSGLGTTDGITFYLEGRSINNNIKELDKKAKELESALIKYKEIKSAFHSLDMNTEQIKIIANVDKSKFYGVDLKDIYNTLNYIYSNYNVNFAYIMQGLVWVILQGEYKYRATLQDISNIYIKNKHGILIPITNLVASKAAKLPLMVERFNNYPATQIIVTPNKGYSSGTIMKIIANEMHNKMKGYDYEWVGITYMQNCSEHIFIITFIFSIIMIYLVLCAFYGMWRLPIIVLMVTPFALLCALTMLLLSHHANDIYFQISLVTTLGLSTKNIILLLNLSMQEVNKGINIREAVLKALHLRFRPIIMTSITFLLGAIPLLFATGADSNAEYSVGIGVIGGMLGSMVLSPLFVPSYFLLLMKNYKNYKNWQ